MTAVKGLALGIVVVTGVALEARGEPVRRGWDRGSWRWTSWVAGRGVFQTGFSGTSAIGPVVSSPPIVPPPTAFVPPPPAPAPAPPPPPPVAFVPPPPAPHYSYGLGRFATPTAVATAFVADPAPPPAFGADLFLNFGDGDFAQADFLTVGGARPWYYSGVVTRLYGGVPDGPQRAAFTDSVLRHVQEVVRRNGLPLRVTDRADVATDHTISFVSNTSNAVYPDAIGIASLGTDGFTFVDKFGYAGTAEALAIALANNALHEGGHAVVGLHDGIGHESIDDGNLPWSVLSNPATNFSAAAVQELTSKDYRRASNLLGGFAAAEIHGQSISAQPVPEPATLGLWAVALCGVAVSRRCRRRPGLESAPRA